MPRWQPGARERLQATTLELFAEQGFEATTVAEIASRAGLTERTFFRYFTDKREVLFAGQDVFEGMFVDHIVAAPPDTEPFTVVTRAVRAVATDFFPPERHPYSRQRQTIIDANPGLQERELLKLAGLTTAMADASARARHAGAHREAQRRVRRDGLPRGVLPVGGRERRRRHGRDRRRRARRSARADRRAALTPVPTHAVPAVRQNRTPDPPHAATGPVEDGPMYSVPDAAPPP